MEALSYSTSLFSVLLILGAYGRELQDQLADGFEVDPKTGRTLGSKGEHYYDFYTKVENALVNDSKQLDKLRHIFMASDIVQLDFKINLIVDNVCEQQRYNCKNSTLYKKSFCQVNNTCKLCQPWIGNYMSTASQKATTEDSIRRLSLLHGSLLSIFVLFYDRFDTASHDSVYKHLNITLNIEQIKCNPTMYDTHRFLTEIITWIKVYAEEENIPNTWDLSQKGISKNDEDDIWLVTNMNLISILEYLFVSLSLSLVIARFFPAIHNQIVSKVNRPEHQSLYWGTVIVSNIFTYSLLFWSMCFTYGLLSLDRRPLPLFRAYWSMIFIFTPYCQQAVVYVILFIGATVGTLRGNSQYQVPIPSAIGKYMISISLCCCCCYFNCYKPCSHRRSKILHTLVVFSLMNFVYHNIMESLSVAFMLFIEETRLTVITVVILYASFMVFMIFVCSHLLLHLFKSKSSFLKCCIRVCGALPILPAVILLVIVYMYTIISLNPKGVSGLVIGLIPSLFLSTGSWYIKKRIEKQMAQTTDQDIIVLVADSDLTQESADERQRLLP